MPDKNGPGGCSKKNGPSIFNQYLLYGNAVADGREKPGTKTLDSSPRRFAVAVNYVCSNFTPK